MIAKVSSFGLIDEDVEKDALSHAINTFLFAEVGVQGNGMALSVLSLLSRQNIDPWREASLLASLTRKAAIERLTQTIVRMPDCMWSDAQAATMASRLISLLPAHATAAARAGTMQTRDGKTFVDHLSSKLRLRPIRARQQTVARSGSLVHLYLALTLLVSVLAGLTLHAARTQTLSMHNDRDNPTPALTHPSAPAASQFRFR